MTNPTCITNRHNDWYTAFGTRVGDGTKDNSGTSHAVGDAHTCIYVHGKWIDSGRGNAEGAGNATRDSFADGEADGNDEWEPYDD